MSGTIPDCVACGFIEVIPENWEVVDILFQFQNTFIDGMGGINIGNIKYVIDLVGVEDEDIILRKILIYLSAALAKRNEDLKDGTKN